MQQIPVYAFTGFLESGKTKFIQETLEDPRFNGGERTWKSSATIAVWIQYAYSVLAMVTLQLNAGALRWKT